MMSRQLPLGGSYLVATSALKLNVQRAFHSLAALKSSTSNKSNSNSNSYMYSIHFSQNLYREKNASLFYVTPSRELLKLFPNCLFSPFLAFLHKHSDCRILVLNNRLPEVLHSIRDWRPSSCFSMFFILILSFICHG